MGLFKSIDDILSVSKLEKSPIIVEKIYQLYQTSLLNYPVVVTGMLLSGRSTILMCVKKLIENLNQCKIKTVFINLNGDIDVYSFYGHFNPVSHAWNSGINLLKFVSATLICDIE